MCLNWNDTYNQRFECDCMHCVSKVKDMEFFKHWKNVTKKKPKMGLKKDGTVPRNKTQKKKK